MYRYSVIDKCCIAHTICGCIKYTPGIDDEIASLQATIKSQEELIGQLKSSKTINFHN